MSIQHNAPWHRESYDRFLQQGLPDLLAERLPLAAYHVEATGEFARRVTVGVSGAAGQAEVRFAGIPACNADGLFDVKGQKRVVLPVAYGEDLSTARVECVGEMMLEQIQDRLGEAPREMKWDEALLRSWLPLDAWLGEFIETLDADYVWPYLPEWVTPGKEPPRVQPLDGRNWLASRTHLRRIVIAGAKRPWSPGQAGRVCPFETPEGTNLGKIAHIAVGATIRDGRVVIEDARPEAGLGLSASMIPLLEHDEAARVMMGANMARQWVPAAAPEVALVQTGNEPDAAGFWCGCDFLTAFLPLGVATFEDGIVLSESAARRLASDQPVEVGDKLSNRHGTKGVVSQILADEQMPHLADGTPADLVYSFIGLHTRQNFGQVREAVLGRIARKRGKAVVVAPFARLTDEELRRQLKEVGLSESGMETLRMGRDGKGFERASTAGWVYWGRTEHIARSKITVSTEPQRCMRQGENEYYGLRDAGALANLLETYNLRNAARTDAATLADRVAAGPVELAEPPSPLFERLVQRLAAGGVLAALEEGQVSFRFASCEGVLPVLKLAQAIRHPWLGERELAEIGRVEGVPGYERIVEVNERLGKLLASQAPASLREKVLGQLRERVDAYLRRALQPEGWAESAATAPNAQVMFSAKAVLAPPIGVRSDQVGLAEEIAWGLFEPLVARELGDKELARSHDAKATAALDEIMAKSWVIVNRAPTTGPTSLMAFHPVRIAEPVIRMPVQVNRLMNADYDGDQAGVFLPLTEAGQREAGEKLSLLGHLKRDPSILPAILPYHEAMWGLARLGERISRVAGAAIPMPGGCLTHDTLVAGMQRVLREWGVEKVLEMIDELTQRGFEVCGASGASLSPFLDGVVKQPVEPAGEDSVAWKMYVEELHARIASMQDFADPAIGAQLLAVRSGTRGTVTQLARLVGPLGPAAGADGEPMIIRHSIGAGLTPGESYALAVAMRERIGELHTDMDRTGKAFRQGNQPKGFNVLARASRSEYPGVVFAQAAAAGESDPLTDLDARVFVGMGERQTGRQGEGETRSNG